MYGSDGLGPSTGKLLAAGLIKAGGLSVFREGAGPVARSAAPERVVHALPHET